MAMFPDDLAVDRALSIFTLMSVSPFVLNDFEILVRWRNWKWFWVVFVNPLLLFFP